jgi:hypothetical protein
MPKPGSTTRSDVWKCRACRRQFTVLVGTILQGSHVKRTVWLKAIYLLCSSGRPMPVHQLHEILEIHYDTATSMMRRVRYALDQATSLALDCRPTLDFHQTLERILEAPPQGAIRRDASPAVAWSAGAP